MTDTKLSPINPTTLPVSANRRLVYVQVDPATTTVVQPYVPSSSGNDEPLWNIKNLGSIFNTTQTGAPAPTFGSDFLKTVQNLQNFSGVVSQAGVPDQSGAIGSPDPGAFNITAIKARLSEYITVRLQDRGGSGNDAYYAFLVNPKSLSVDRQVVDVQAQARGGWQLGIWGDDVISISMSGQTAGQYFAAGLSDDRSEYSASYANLLALLALYENNGYWFEGENMGSGPLAPDVTRSRIQMHADVVLTVGNFIWYGLFQDLSIVEDANNPYNASFTLSFMAWKERFSKTSPWRNSLASNVYRGHSYEAYKASLARKKAAAEAKARIQALSTLDTGSLGAPGFTGGFNCTNPPSFNSLTPPSLFK
jgi:hypothetical protein